jgi:hypothetical protein
MLYYDARSTSHQDNVKMQIYCYYGDIGLGWISPSVGHFDPMTLQV